MFGKMCLLGRLFHFTQPRCWSLCARDCRVHWRHDSASWGDPCFETNFPWWSAHYWSSLPFGCSSSFRSLSPSRPTRHLWPFRMSNLAPPCVAQGDASFSTSSGCPIGHPNWFPTTRTCQCGCRGGLSVDAPNQNYYQISTTTYLLGKPPAYYVGCIMQFSKGAWGQSNSYKPTMALDGLFGGSHAWYCSTCLGSPVSFMDRWTSYQLPHLHRWILFQTNSWSWWLWHRALCQHGKWTAMCRCHVKNLPTNSQVPFRWVHCYVVGYDRCTSGEWFSSTSISWTPLYVWVWVRCRRYWPSSGRALDFFQAPGHAEDEPWLHLYLATSSWPWCP